MQRYNPKEIEPKWQAQWETDKVYHASDSTDKPKKYVLEYFPYPSGAAMHVGHVRNYTIGDAIARFNRMQGYNVLHPMGWDAFGLPAENYAIKNNVSPRVAIDENTARFKQQLMQMGFSYDWSREIDSTDPKYYKWTQWFFLLLFKKGLAYQQESLQWWCPHDKTVLANEQVEAGRCWRCGNEVEKKSLKQWFFKITDYADRLIDDLDDVNWSESIKSMQRNWIGRSRGAEVDFQVVDSVEKVTVFTTRVDTIFSGAFLVLAPEHNLVKQITTDEQREAVDAYIKQTQSKSDIERQAEGDKEKTGVFTGAYAVNPANDERIPIWIGDFVLGGYGTGAIFGDIHDERDFDFLKKFDIPARVTVIPDDEAEAVKVQAKEYSYTKEGILIDSGEFTGMKSSDAREKITAWLAEKQAGKEVVNYKMRDWLISRQRYWGAPIPIIHCMNCVDDEVKNSSVAEIDFADSDNFALFSIGQKTAITRAKDDDKTPEYSSLKIGDIVKLTDSNTGKSLYANITAAHFYEKLDNLFNDKAVIKASFARDFETEQALRDQYDSNRPNYSQLIDANGAFAWEVSVITSPVAVSLEQLPVLLPEVKSYEPSGDGRSPLATVPEFVNTTCPDCGGPAERETDTMDGFACSSWYFLRFADPHNEEVPFTREKADFWLPVDDYIGGAEHAVMHLLYARFWTKVMYDDGLINFQEPFKTLRNQGMILAPDGLKMSKSKGNTIEPDSIIEQGYGADSIRIMELFIGPWNQRANWSVEGMGGAYRFLQRIWTLVQEFKEAEKGSEDSADLQRATHKAIKKVTADLHELSFNTAIAALMETVNELYRIKAEAGFVAAQWQWALESLLQLVAPFAPHMAEELWQQLGKTTSVHTSEWPGYDDKYLVQDTITFVVQINGKMRAEIHVAADADKDTVIAAAESNDRAKVYLDGQTIRKTIFVSGKLVNFVV